MGFFNGHFGLRLVTYCFNHIFYYIFFSHGHFALERHESAARSPLTSPARATSLGTDLGVAALCGFFWSPARLGDKLLLTMLESLNSKAPTWVRTIAFLPPPQKKNRRVFWSNWSESWSISLKVPTKTRKYRKVPKSLVQTKRTRITLQSLWGPDWNDPKQKSTFKNWTALASRGGSTPGEALSRDGPALEVPWMFWLPFGQIIPF